MNDFAALKVVPNPQQGGGAHKTATDCEKVSQPLSPEFPRDPKAVSRQQQAKRTNQHHSPKYKATCVTTFLQQRALFQGFNVRCRA
jgi:hypothetical protein